MSSTSSEETEMVWLSEEPSWTSVESIFNQKLSKLAESNSDSWFNISSNFNTDLTLSNLEIGEFCSKKLDEKNSPWVSVCDRTWFPRLIRTRSLLKEEIEILKINMSNYDNMVPLRHSQMLKRLKMEAKRRRRKKIKQTKKKVSCLKKFELSRSKDLVCQIEMSESAKKDKTAWKFLRRGSSLRKEYINSTKLELEIQVLEPDFDRLSDSRNQNIQPVKITCPNCLFYVTTTVKNVKSIRFKLISVFSAAVGCIFPDVFYTFKDTVHLCPLCKIYLGFCPAFRVRAKRNITSSLLNLTRRSKKKEKIIGEKKMITGPQDEMEMVSASSTSAKNLFVESKLRLSDRVQVNVNNIAAITRQIQRGSKSNENLMTAAKNFAIQEAAIENSETNLKKLMLLTTHINNQLDSLHNSSSKMEVVLEQVRSMQR